MHARIPLLLALAVGCTDAPPPATGLDWSPTVVSAPPPPELILTADGDAVPGAGLPVTLHLPDDAPEGLPFYLVRGAEVGDGTCPAPLRGECLGVTGDPEVTGPSHSVAHPDGTVTAEFRWVAPADLAADTVALQGVYVGASAFLSPAISVPVDPDGDADGDGWRDVDDCGPDDPHAYPGAPEVLGDGIDQDCVHGDLEALWGPYLAVGDVVLTEIMTNPLAVDDELGEWFEVTNLSDDPVDLTGLTVSDSSGEAFTVAASVVVDAGARAVLGVEADPLLNGGVTLDHVYDRGELELGNGDDDLSLAYDGLVLDTVAWDNGLTFPDRRGRSMALDPTREHPAANDVGGAWCTGRDEYGDGDEGTPGAPNPSCEDADGDGFARPHFGGPDCDDDDRHVHPGAEEIANDGIDQDCDGEDLFARVAAELTAGDLVLTELMTNPHAVDDEFAEWFELYNPGETAIDLQGLVFSDDDHDTMTIDVQVVVLPGAYAVLGVNGDEDANGGVTLDHVYSQDDLLLGNGEDELNVTNDATTIDALAWDNGVTFPDQRGASMTLDPSRYNAVDNDDGTSWCEGRAVYGAGDTGTPGAANDSCADADGDGEDSEPWGGTDCDDADPHTYAGAVELCDGVRNDCDDEAWVDDAGIATFFADDGTTADLSAASGEVTAGAPGELALCEGDFPFRVLVRADDVRIVGAGVDATQLGAGEGSVIDVWDRTGLEVSDLTIAGARADYFDDGAVILSRSSATLTNLAIEDTVDDDFNGAVVADWDSTVVLTAVTFSGNATGDAALTVTESDATCTGCIFVDNVGGRYGGGAYVDEGSLTLVDTTFTRNHAEYDGGGLAARGGSTLTATGVRFEDNTAGDAGGAVMLSTSDATLVDGVLEGNAAGDGTGGIGSSSSTLAVTSTDFVDNVGADVAVYGFFVWDVTTYDLGLDETFSCDADRCE